MTGPLSRALSNLNEKFKGRRASSTSEQLEDDDADNKTLVGMYYVYVLPG
jgi:hypothetical protein